MLIVFLFYLIYLSVEINVASCLDLFVCLHCYYSLNLIIFSLHRLLLSYHFRLPPGSHVCSYPLCPYRELQQCNQRKLCTADDYYLNKIKITILINQLLIETSLSPEFMLKLIITTKEISLSKSKRDDDCGIWE